MDTFEVIADPGRRRILDLLRHGPAAAGTLVAELAPLSQPAVSRHLRVLRDAGMVRATVDGQRRIYALDPGALREVDRWLARYRHFWNDRLDRLDTHLRTRKDRR